MTPKTDRTVVFTVNEDTARTQTIQKVMARKATWEVVTEWERRRGRLDPVTVTINALDAVPVTGDVLRAIPLGTLHRQARAEAASYARRKGKSSANFVALVNAMVPELADLGGGPRRGVAMSNDDLEQIAAVYRKAWNEGRAVTRAVADAFKIAESTAGKRIMKAREAGLLDDVGRSTR